MDRIPETDLMEGPDQALAYAQADFSEPHNRFIELFKSRFGSKLNGPVLDLGCGPGDICRRFARAFPACQVHGVDGSTAMLKLARASDNSTPYAARIHYQLAYLPDGRLPRQHYHALISNSLLHHLQDPLVLWQSILQCGKPGAPVFVMDLLRPDSLSVAEHLVEEYATGEPEILKNDFRNSLLAAYRPSEVTAQTCRLGLDHLEIEIVSDRHFIVFGRL